MALALQTGVLAQLYTEDETQYIAIQKELNQVGDFLNKNGVAHTFQEPTQLPNDRIWSTDMYGYSGLHYLRRVAAYLFLEKRLPPPGDWSSSNDPILVQYFEQYFGGNITTLTKQFLTRKKVFPFEHLIIHSDTDGYYFPIDFQRVIVTNDSELCGGFIGSTYRLIEELQQLTQVLQLDLNRTIDDIALYDAAENQGNGSELWEQYGVESFTCLKLYKGCLESIENRCVLAFR